MKSKLHRRCLEILEEKKAQLMSELEMLKNSAEEDTKSSMGDKYETSREMINLEKGKIAEQLTHVDKMLLIVLALDPSQACDKGELGALMMTSNGIYYLATSIGNVTLGDQQIFVISPVSPLGRVLLDKKEGDTLDFRGKTSVINSIL